MLRPIPGRVRTGDERIALHSSDISPVPEVIHVYVWNPEISNAKWARVNAQALGIDLVVDAEQLGKPGVTESALQYLVIPKI